MMSLEVARDVGRYLSHRDSAIKEIFVTSDQQVEKGDLRIQ